jgi:hypothetical protein
MFIYLNGTKERKNPSHFLTVAPAMLPVEGVTPPAHWTERDGSPTNLKVAFQHGCARVDDVLGQWLIATGHAERGNLRQSGKSLLGSLANTIAGR